MQSSLAPGRLCILPRLPGHMARLAAADGGVGAAGYRALSLDMRGYGGSSAPHNAELYTPFHTVGDLIGVLDALGVSTATIVGHDFGASVAWNAAMMRPDRFTAVFGLSVPFQAQTGKSFLQQLLEAGKDDYMFRQKLPYAEKEWKVAATTIPRMLYWTSGSAPSDESYAGTPSTLLAA